MSAWWDDIGKYLAGVLACILFLGVCIAWAIRESSRPDHTSRDNAAVARSYCAAHGGVQQIADYYEFVVTCKDGTVVGH